MKQNDKNIKNKGPKLNQETIYHPSFKGLTKKQIKKKQRRYFKEEKGESLLSKLSKSSSLMIKKSKRKKPLRWSENETSTFYKCLEFFGKDFEMITSVFHNKRKRQIMRKFHKERKRHPDRLQLSLKKHDANKIQKNYKEDTFFDNVFDRTDTSDDDASYMAGTCVLGNRVGNGMEKKVVKNHSVILEGLIEQEFEREIDIANHQNGMNIMNRKNNLNDLLFQINTENVTQNNPHKIFEGNGLYANNINDKKMDFFPKAIVSSVICKNHNDFWVSNRIEEEQTEQPPPKNQKSFEDNMNDKGNYWGFNNFFEEFDNQLKEQSDVKIKPLNFYLEQEEFSKKK